MMVQDSRKNSVREIRVLPPDLANQIAAGEVVERPASVVKELMENSLDAGATQIDVEVLQGGCRLIRVSDNGCGMTPGQATLCLERHATSKIHTVDDLFKISSLGFRGEAIPSIASVSRMVIKTRCHGEIEGCQVHVGEDGKIEQRPTSCPPGTEVVVEDLFYNTPARLKFLKSDSTEKRHITQTVTRLALAHPHVRIVLTSEGKRTIEAPKSLDLLDRCSAVLGSKTAQLCYAVSKGAGRGNVAVSGVFGAPSTSRRNTNGVYIFVNGRFIRDRRLQAAVTVGYGGLLERGRYPVVILNIDLPPNDVDVNVHPAKTEVRFRDPDTVFRAVRGALLEGLSQAPWAARNEEKVKVYTLKGPAEGGSAGLPWSAQQGSSEADSSGHSLAPTHPVQTTLRETGRYVADSSGRGGWWSSGLERRDEASTDSGSAFFADLRFIGPLGPVYLLCEDGDGLVLIDQHAAHERVTFERLKKLYSGHHREIQSLLLPVHITLEPTQRQTLEEHLDFFSGVGFELDLLTEETYVIRSVPAILVGASYEQVLRDAIDELAQFGHSERVDSAVDSVLSRMACHGSIRAGDRLNEASVKALFAQMDRVDFRANCPHGRPVFFRMSWHEIEKRFHRK